MDLLLPKELADDAINRDRAPVDNYSVRTVALASMDSQDIPWDPSEPW